MGKHKNQRTSRYSSGMRRVRKARQTIGKLKSKVKRWDRYKTEIEAKDRKGSVKRWSTDGLLKRISQLESMVTKGSTTEI